MVDVITKLNEPNYFEIAEVWIDTKESVVLLGSQNRWYEHDIIPLSKVERFETEEGEKSNIHSTSDSEWGNGYRHSQHNQKSSSKSSISEDTSMQEKTNTGRTRGLHYTAKIPKGESYTAEKLKRKAENAVKRHGTPAKLEISVYVEDLNE